MLTNYLARTKPVWMPAKSSSSLLKPVPRCKAILICEQIIVDQLTSRPSLINTTEYFEVAEFPCELPPFRVFVQLAEGIGKYAIVLEIHDRGDDEIVLRTGEIVIEFQDRLDRLNLDVGIGSLSLLLPTAYDIVVFANGEEVDRQRLTVLLAEETNHEE